MIHVRMYERTCTVNPVCEPCAFPRTVTSLLLSSQTHHAALCWQKRNPTVSSASTIKERKINLPFSFSKHRQHSGISLSGDKEKPTQRSRCDTSELSETSKGSFCSPKAIW